MNWLHGHILNFAASIQGIITYVHLQVHVGPYYKISWEQMYFACYYGEITFTFWIISHHFCEKKCLARK